jgi:hypothetical protein
MYSRTDATRVLDRLAVMLRTLCAYRKPIVGFTSGAKELAEPGSLSRGAVTLIGLCDGAVRLKAVRRRGLRGPETGSGARGVIAPNIEEEPQKATMRPG